MKGLNEDIKTGRFSRAYLLYGDEEYLRLYFRKKLSAAICDPSDSMNCSFFEGDGISPARIIDLAETLPFFKERRLIVITNSSFFSDGCDELADYLKDICETTYFIFSESSVDKRTRMFKAVQKAGRCVELAPPDENALVDWAGGILKRSGREIRRNTLLRLFDRSGTNMGNLKNELDKLISYTDDRESGIIEDADVDAICTVELKNRVFEMIDAVTSHKSAKAFSLYYELLAQKVSPYMMLPAIYRQFNIMLQIKELSAATRDISQIASKIGLKPFIARKYMSGAGAYSSNALRGLMENCLSLEQEAKSGRIDDKLAIELLLYSVSKNRELKL
jgi:DNA polymerase-3 subunit delta